MAMIDVAQRAPFGAITTHRVVSGVYGALQSMRDTIQARMDAAATARELGRLNPRMLEDIGLSAGDVVAMRVRAGLI